MAADLLGFGFVFAQSQAAAGMLLRSSLAKTPKSLAARGSSFSSNALATRGHARATQIGFELGLFFGAKWRQYGGKHAKVAVYTPPGGGSWRRLAAAGSTRRQSAMLLWFDFGLILA
jgi:hypothetical protein